MCYSHDYKYEINLGKIPVSALSVEAVLSNLGLGLASHRGEMDNVT